MATPRATGPPLTQTCNAIEQWFHGNCKNFISCNIIKDQKLNLRRSSFPRVESLFHQSPMALLSMGPLQPGIQRSRSEVNRQAKVCSLPSPTCFSRISNSLCRDSHVVAPHLPSHHSWLRIATARQNTSCQAADNAGAGPIEQPNNVASGAATNRDDLLKFSALGMLFFCSTFNYTVLVSICLL